MQFTDKYIKNLKPKSSSYDLREGSGQGFGIRVMPSGHKSWVFLYNFEGKKQRMTLGAYPAISLAEARALHRNAIRCLASDRNPANEQHRIKLEARLSGTVNDLIDEYLEKWAKPRKRSWQEDERILRKDAASLIGKRKAKDITRRDVILILDQIIKRGAPIAANRTLAAMRRMFNFAVEQDIIENTPCYGVKAPSKENRRDRLLTENEIRTIWQGLKNASMSEHSKLALKLQLVTAQRKGEIVSAEWDEFDLSKGVWNIPATKAKNGNPHYVPLSNLAIELLREIKVLSNGSKWVFPSPNKERHVTPESIDHAIRRNFHVFKNVKPFSPHDTRRAAASFMTALGTPRLVVSKILNHTENSVTAIYDRHSYDKEKREALEKWGQKLKEIILNPPNLKLKIG